MSEEQSVEIPQTAGTNTESDLPKKKISTAGFDIVHLEKRVTATFSILSKVFVIVLLGFASIFIARELGDDGFVITQVNVPASLEDIGYTGPVVGKRMVENLNRIIEITRTAAVAQGYTDGNSQADVSVDMVGLGVPVRGMIELIGNALGINRKKKISADITIEGNVMAVVLSITGEAPERIEVSMDANVGVPLKKVIAEASETIMKYTNGGVLALYYTNYVSDGEKAIQTAKYLLAKHKGDRNEEARSYSQWAYGLMLQNKLDAAEQKVRQGLAISPNSTHLYSTWGQIFERRGNYAEAISMKKRAFELLPTDAPNFMRAAALTNIGVALAYNGLYDSAIYYCQKSLRWDENFNMAYYNLACLYSYRSDTTRCLDELEKALIYGYNPKLIPEDPDLAGLLNHPRMKELMLRYGE